MEEQPHRREEDKGVVARVNMGLTTTITRFWDWIDDRDIDKHATALGLIVFFCWMTVDMVLWGYRFAQDWLKLANEGKNISGTEVAAVLAAIGGPWGILTGAVLSAVVAFYFKARH